MTGLRASLTEIEVGHDPHQPSHQTLAVAQGVQTEPGTGDRLGGQVFGILPVSGEPPGSAEDLRECLEYGSLEPGPIGRRFRRHYGVRCCGSSAGLA